MFLYPVTGMAMAGQTRPSIGTVQLPAIFLLHTRHVHDTPHAPLPRHVSPEFREQRRRVEPIRFRLTSAAISVNARRIDHGVRAVEDPALVALLADRGIPLGICPTSNRVLKVYPSLAEHPIDSLRRAGVKVSINTDDPSLLGTTLPAEYASCASQFDWDDAVLRQLASTSIDSSFADAATKRRLHAALAAW